MFKQKFILEVKGSQDRVYRFECDPQAPLGEMHDALYTMKGVIVEQLMKKQEAEKGQEEEPKCEEKCADECKEEEK